MIDGVENDMTSIVIAFRVRGTRRLWSDQTTTAGKPTKMNLNFQVRKKQRKSIKSKKYKNDKFDNSISVDALLKRGGVKHGVMTKFRLLHMRNVLFCIAALV